MCKNPPILEKRATRRKREERKRKNYSSTTKTIVTTTENIRLYTREQLFLLPPLLLHGTLELCTRKFLTQTLMP